MPFPLDEKFIISAEERLKAKFPEGFRNAMMEVNAREVYVKECILAEEFDFFPFFDDSDRKRVKRTCNDIVKETMSAREGWELGDDLVAIAGNGTGDLLLYRIGEDGQMEDGVLWWNHETRDLTLVASNVLELPEPEWDEDFD
ncbi:MAG: SMI1/KNR4 family protein [Kangiellaceae bacterium]|nr:SMI1/KNR4 family protein [Kangiellaceae bacterium]MCW9001030.1 SMI1/KNR4 family protein [Kangiellaceae bacterium]MCW9016485.1 SMI1/KNR4 family protein [Kangiellaceae bacterium]